MRLAIALVLGLSATAFGGGVAEIQYTLIPLMIDAGLDLSSFLVIIPGGDHQVGKLVPG
jgi:hypothetical protein